MINKDNKKISLKEFIWMGFNFCVGITFLGSMAGLTDILSPDNVGINIVWIFGLEGIIATMCAYAFAKLSRIHNNSSNGACYVYARTAYGRFVGYLTGFMLYITMPFTIAEQIMTLIRGMLDPEYSHSNIEAINANWGSFTDLYLDLIGIVIYGASALTIFFGMKTYKKVIISSTTFQWIAGGIMLVVGFILCIIHGKENYAGWFKSTENGGWSHLSFSGFMNAFISCFYYFVGFEQVIVSTKNMENPKKNLSKGLLIVMAIITTFYIVVTFIFFGAIIGGENNQWSQNMNISTWQLFTKNGKPILWLEIVGIVIMFASQLTAKIQIAAMNGFIGGVMLQPLAKEGYISEKYGNLTKENVPTNGIKLNLYFTIACIILWLIIPDIINGILNSQGKEAIPFNVNQLTSASGVLVLFIYGMALSVVMIQWYRGNLKLKFWELFAFPTIFFVVIFFFVYHYYDIVTEIIQFSQQKSLTNDDIQTLLGAIVEVVFVILITLFAIFSYRFYYIPKLKKRLAENPDLQRKLDSIFVIKTFEKTQQEVIDDKEPEIESEPEIQIT